MPRFARPTSLARLMAGGVFATLVGLVAAWLPVAAQRPPGPREVEATPEQIVACLASGTAETARNRSTRVMRFIGTTAGRALPHPLRHNARTPMETAARGYLDVCGSLFGLSGDPGELELARAATRNGRSVVRFQQKYRGIPVLGGELVVHLDRDRNIIATSGHILPRTRLATAATFTAAQATRTAIDEIARAYDVPSQELTATAPRLWIYSETLLGPGQGPAQLVWRIDVATRDLRPVRELVLVDAIRGNLVLHFNQVEMALERQTFSANNTLSLPGDVVCDETNPACAGEDAHAEAAHAFAGDTYSFFASRFGRDGIIGTGSPIRSTVHYGSEYANAFWNGSQVVFGDAFGFPLADDVVAHELAHGITQNTVSLFNIHQSGAISESLSDLWGELVDQTNSSGTDGPDVRWLIGEDIAGLGAVRNMSDPAAFGHPDRMTSPLYQTGDDDNGGIHANSGVNNKAASLMVDGGTFNGQTVVPLGIEKTARIYYEAQTNLLTSSADYEDLFHALFQACSNLVGTAGIVVADCDEVRHATLAVEMDRLPMPSVTLDAHQCTAGGPLRVFFDDFENGAAGFSTMHGAGANRWSYDSPYGEFARSGQHMLYADDSPAGVSDSSIAMTASVTVPERAFLHFAHAYGFDQPNFDGGIVEYSVDEGVTWVDAGSLFDRGEYSGAIVSGGANPLAGRSAFVGSSHGYVTSRLDLSSLAGQRVRVRWRLGLDSIGFGSGWWIDDVEIFSCPEVATSGVPIGPSPANGAIDVPTNAVLGWSATAPVQRYDVAFGTVNPPPLAATDLTTASFAPPITGGTTYYWQVTARNSDGSETGPVWSFTTETPSTDLLVVDSFTGNGALTTHAPDFSTTLSPWTVTGGPSIPTLADGVVGIAAGSGHVQATLQTGVADIRMGVDYRVDVNPYRVASLVFRLTDANNHLLLMLHRSALYFLRREGGAYTLLASSEPLAPLDGGSVQRMEVQTSGSVLTGLWNGVPVVQAVDAFQRHATRHGVDWDAELDSTASFDNLDIRSNITLVSSPSGPPTAPSNPLPVDGAAAVPTGLRLSWNAVGATRYDISFGTANPPLPSATDLSIPSFTPVGLTANTTYFWQVTTRNDDGTTAGPVWSFTTASADTDLLVSDTFTGSGPLRSHSPDLNAIGAPWIVTGGPPTPTLSGGVVGLMPGGSWHLQASIDTGVSDVRMAVDYRVGGKPNQLAGLVFRFVDENNHLLLLYYDSALRFYRCEAGDYALLASSDPLAPIDAGSTQRLEVRASGSTLSGLWNGVEVVQVTETFQQNATRHGLDWDGGYDPDAAFDNLEVRNGGSPVAPPDQPANPFPEDGATEIAPDTVLAWNASGATSYDVAFGTANPPPTLIAEQTTPIIAPTLVAGTTYYWQVTARNAGGSTVGPVWTFTTAPTTLPPSSLTLVNPANGATGVPITATLQWTAADATNYDIAFGTANPPPTIVTDTTSTSYAPTLGFNTTYYWQITARNAGGAISSEVVAFTTTEGAVCVDADFDRLCDSYETGTGIYVNPTNTGTSPLLGDTDADGLRDGDEVLGTTAGLNLPALGANPNTKNILLEYDWIDDDDEPALCAAHSHRPTVAALARLTAAFAAAPVSNPDGTTGITLIQDYGQGGAFSGGNPVAHGGIISGSLTGDFYAIKSANFAPNRNGYFHYVAMAHWYTANLGSSGVAEIAGDDLIVSLGCFGSTENVANTIMHELGHNLGLQHGGNQSCNWKPNYNSVMNYRFQFPGVDLSCNAQGSSGEANTLDYSRGTRIPLDELNLNENAGVCGGTPIDWNFNGLLESVLSYDLNRTSSFPNASTAVDNGGCSATLSTLTDHNDWGAVTFLGISDSSGASLVRPTVDCNNPLMPRVVPEEWRRP